ncbi:hypothetical protein PYW07_005416 [Mythimna separata]|uniref:TIL domain-containing protein n=1 Tax=Mythimna separata TaxID=271217 RepID=A0AAD7YEA2_MYTSE|nr:hypothetical protein PYW07_005416 [Mythimna separata]
MTCKENQVYKRCEALEKTCAKRNPKVPSPCVPGCFCQDGYVKAPNGQCVRPEECPKAQITRTNQSTNVGPTTLPPTEVQFQLQIGPMVHDSQPSHHDPSVEDCGLDEAYLTCGWCEPSCTNPLPICSNKVCTRGCLCRPPLLRHHSGRCVEAKDCFPESCNDPNEEFVCLFGCELRCDGRCIKPRYCVLGCYCKLGLLRDTTGLCVLKENCTNSTEVRGTPVNLKKKLSNDEGMFNTLTWKTLNLMV